MGNKHSSMKVVDSTPSQQTSPQTNKKLKNKSFRKKNASVINVSNQEDKDTNKEKKNQKKNDKRSKSTDNLTNKNTPAYTPSVFKSPTTTATNHLGNKQLSCIIMPDQELDIKVYKKNRDSIADRHLTIQRSQRTRSLQRSRSSALRKSTDTLLSTSSRQPSRYTGSNGYQACLTLEEDTVWNDVPDGLKGVTFPCEEKIQRHKLVFQRSFEELFVDYYYTSLQEVVQLSAIIIAYKRMMEDGEISHDPINLYQYINADGDLPVDLFTSSNESTFIPALPLSSLNCIKTLRTVKEGVSEVGIEDQLCVCHELVRCVVTEACKEVTGVFEYQLSVLSDQVSVETVARHAAERAIEYLRSGNRFVERDSIVEGVAYLPIEEAVTNNKTHFVSAILGDDREFKWDVAKMFTSCALRLYPNNLHYYNFDTTINPSNDDWENAVYMTNPQCLPLVFGYRGAMFKKDIEVSKDLISQVDLNLFTEVVAPQPDDVHCHYVPIDVKKKKAMIKTLFRHPQHRNAPHTIPQSPTSSCSSRYYKRNSSSIQQDNYISNNSHNNNYSHHNSYNNKVPYNNYLDASQDGRSSKQSGVILTGDEATRHRPGIPDRSTITSHDSDVTMVNAADAYQHRYTYCNNNQAPTNGAKDNRRLTENNNYSYDNNNNNKSNFNRSHNNNFTTQRYPHNNYNKNNYNNNLNNNYNNNFNNNLTNNYSNNGRLSSQSVQPEGGFARNSRVTQSYYTIRQPSQHQQHEFNTYNNNNFNSHNNNEKHYPNNFTNNIQTNNQTNYPNNISNHHHTHYKNLIKRKPTTSPKAASPSLSGHHSNAIIETSFDYNSDEVLVSEITSNHVIPNDQATINEETNGVMNSFLGGAGNCDDSIEEENTQCDFDNVFNDKTVKLQNDPIHSPTIADTTNKVSTSKLNGKLPPKPPQRTVSSSRQSVPATEHHHTPLQIHVTTKAAFHQHTLNNHVSNGLINHSEFNGLNNGFVSNSIVSNGNESDVMINGVNNTSLSNGVNNISLSNGFSHASMNNGNNNASNNALSNGFVCKQITNGAQVIESNGDVNGTHVEVNGNLHTNGAISNGQNDVLDFSSFLKLVERQNKSLQSFDQKIESFRSSKNNFTNSSASNHDLSFTQLPLQTPVPQPPTVAFSNV